MFKKYELVNNAICLLDLPLTEVSETIIVKGNFERLPTENFIIKISEFSGNVVIGRENIYIISRVGNVLAVGQRACEPVPINDSASENIQQALPFSENAVIEVVSSAEVFKDMQEELTRLEDEKVNIDGGTRTGLTPNSIIYVDNEGDEIIKEFDPVEDNGKALLIDETEGIKYESPGVNIGALDETILLTPTDEFVVKTSTGNKKITTPNLLRANKEVFTLGEAMSAGIPFRMGGNIPYTIDRQSGTNQYSPDGIGNSTTYSRSAVRFQVIHNSLLLKIKVSLKRTSSLFEGELIMRVFSNIPTGANSDQFLIGTSTNVILMSQLSTSPATYDFNFSNISLNAGTYYIEIRRNDEFHSTNQFAYWLGLTTEGDTYPAYTVNSNGQYAPLLQFGIGARRNFLIEMQRIEDNTKIYKTSTGIGETGFLGFTTEIGILDDKVLCDIGGASKLFTGLTSGAIYQINANGTIGIGSTRKIGRAISEDTIIINHNL